MRSVVEEDLAFQGPEVQEGVKVRSSDTSDYERQNRDSLARQNDDKEGRHALFSNTYLGTIGYLTIFSQTTKSTIIASPTVIVAMT